MVGGAATSLRHPTKIRNLTTFGFILVDPGGIEPPPQQCECRVIPLYYGPKFLHILTDYKGTSNS